MFGLKKQKPPQSSSLQGGLINNLSVTTNH